MTITATVTNRAPVPGGTDVVMTVRGTDIRQTRYVRVDPGSTATVLFQVRLTGDRAAVDRPSTAGERSCGSTSPPTRCRHRRT